MSRSSKRRFGISIRADLVNILDKLAEKLRADRSSIVEMALRVFLLDHIHYVVPHQCRGIMVLTGKYDKKILSSIVEEFRDVIHSYIHTHIDNSCVEIMIVSGHSSRISRLHSTLEGSIKGCNVRYIPVRYELSDLYNENIFKTIRVNNDKGIE